MTPMIAMVDYLTKHIYINDNEPLSYLIDKTKTKATDQLVKSLLVNPYFNGMDSSSITDNSYPSFLKEKLESKDPEFAEAVRKYDEVVNNIFHTHNSHLIIEEPEQYLFPETQKNLIYFLLNRIADNTHEHNMTLNTHYA